MKLVSVLQTTGCLILASMAAPSTASASSARTNPSRPPALERAATAYDKAQWSGDRASLERLLADDYHLVNGAGEVENKAQLIADFVDPNFKLAPYNVEHPVETIWKDGAVLSGEVRLSGANGGKPFSAHTRFADVWRREGGRWRVVFTQVTRLTGP